MSKPAGGTKPLSHTPERFQLIQKTQSFSPTELSAISKRNSEYIDHFLTLLILIWCLCVLVNHVTASDYCKVEEIEILPFTIPQAVKGTGVESLENSARNYLGGDAA